MIQPLPSFCLGRFVSLYAWEILTTWQGPHNHLLLMLRTPSGTSFKDALRMVISDLGCIMCQKGLNLLQDMDSHIHASFRETVGDFFSLPAPNIHFSFYLPHNVEMKEAKCVSSGINCNYCYYTGHLAQIETSAWFFYAFTSRQQKLKRVAHKKAKCSSDTSCKRSPIRQGRLQDQFQSIVNTTRGGSLNATCLFKLSVFSVRMLPTAGAMTSRVSGRPLQNTCLCF